MQLKYCTLIIDKVPRTVRGGMVQLKYCTPVTDYYDKPSVIAAVGLQLNPFPLLRIFSFYRICCVRELQEINHPNFWTCLTPPAPSAPPATKSDGTFFYLEVPKTLEGVKCGFQPS